jgi:GNAT superfamily N-acetyltransferase
MEVPDVAMLVEETVTYLEMTSLAQLRPGRPAPAPVAMEKCDAASAAVLRSTFDRIGAPYNWQRRRTGSDVWSDERWRARLAEAGVHIWLAWVADDPAGMVEVEARRGDDVEIVVFGLVPELVGKGFGGQVLTLAARLAWQTEPLDGVAVRRVWLHTSSRDHPGAKPNYERRGFRQFLSERRSREILAGALGAGVATHIWPGARAGPARPL